VDRIDKVSDDCLRIVDYKADRSFDLDHVRTDLQLTLFQMETEQSIRWGRSGSWGWRWRAWSSTTFPRRPPFAVERDDVG
jgi:hypothetical protein